MIKGDSPFFTAAKGHFPEGFGISSNMKSGLRAARTAALFVGSVVGAGFATGQEIALFFGGDGVVSLVVASLFMAVCAFAFLDMGARRVIADPRLLLATDTLLSASSFAVYAAMIAAAEEVLRELTGMAGLSIFFAVGVSLVAGKSISWVSRLNLLAVPLMVGIIALVGSRCVGGESVDFHPVRALAYGGMNLLFSGALMMKEGEGLSLRERIAAAVITGALLFPMMLFMWRCVAGGSGADMPFLSVSSDMGYGTLASLALLLAILTTMASTLYLAADRLSTLTGDRLLSLSLLTLGGILLSTLGFAPIVRAVYPVVSALGLVTTLSSLFFLSSVLWRKKFEHRERMCSSTEGELPKE